MVRLAADRQQRGLALEAGVRDDRAAGRERAGVRQVDQQRRAALDGHEGLLLGLVHAGDRAEQADRVRHAGVGEQRLHRRLFDGPPGVHDDDVVRDVGDHAHVVRDHHDRGAGLALRGLDEVEDLGLDGDVQGRRRLVRDDEPRVVRHRDGDDHALAHAAGELVRERLHALLRAGDPDQPEQLHGPVPRRAAREVRVVDRERLDDLVAHREHGRQGRQRVLEDHRDAVAADLRHLRVALAEQLLALEQDRAADAGVLVEQAHDGQGRDGLARAGLAHDPERAALREVEGDAAHGVDAPRLGREADGEVADGEDGGGHARPPAAEVGSRASRRPSATSAMETVSSVRAAAGK